MYEPSLRALLNDKHVLVVDDEDICLVVTASLLESLGAEVSTFDNALQALRFCRNNAAFVDVVICDLHMPGLKGTELAHALRHEGLECPIIGFSGDTASHNGNEHFALPLVVNKPLQPDELLQALQGGQD